MYSNLVDRFFSNDFQVFILPDKLVLHRGGPGAVSLLARDQVQEFDHRANTDLEYILQQLRRTYRPKPSDRWFLGLPLKHFTLINFTLPQAAQENLHQAVHYGLMRHVPFDLEQMYLQYQQSKKGDFLEISAVVAPKEFIRPYLEYFAAAGLTLHSVFPSIVYWAQITGDGVFVMQRGGYYEVLVQQDQKIVLQNWEQARSNSQDPDWKQAGSLLENLPELPPILYVCQSEKDQQQIEDSLQLRFKQKRVLDFANNALSRKQTGEPKGYAISLLPAKVRKRQKVMSYLILGSICFLLLSLLVWPVSNLAGQKRYLTKLEHSIQRLNHQAENLRQMRDESSQLLDQFQRLVEMKNAYPPTLDILRELTEVTPESAWVYSLKFVDQRISLQGEADSATRVIEALENSSFFREVGFTSPVTKSGNKDRFTLEAKVDI